MTKKGENARVAKWKAWNVQQTKINKALLNRNLFLEREMQHYTELVDYILEHTFKNEFFGEVSKLLELINGGKEDGTE